MPSSTECSVLIDLLLAWFLSMTDMTPHKLMINNNSHDFIHDASRINRQERNCSTCQVIMSDDAQSNGDSGQRAWQALSSSSTKQRSIELLRIQHALEEEGQISSSAF